MDQTEKKGKISIHAVGDIGLMGKVGTAIVKNGNDFPFSKSADVLRDAEIVIGNLEIPFSHSKNSMRSPYESAEGKVHPESINSLKHAGINCLSLANNHIMDLGPSGIEDTIAILDNAGIAHAGAGMNIDEARESTIFKVNGMLIGFLSYAMKGPHTASIDTPGAAPIEDEIILSDLNKLKSKVDNVIISLHFGMIYTDFPTVDQQELCHLLIDSGASMILGHHPHVLQGIESYKNGLIAYSLGEFIFDATFGNVYAKIAREKRKESIILSCELLSKRVERFDIIPVKINENFQPCVLKNKDADSLLDRIGKLSKPLREGRLLNESDIFKKAGADLIPYQGQVYLFHLKKLHILFILKQLTRIRWRHFRLLFGYLRSKFFGT